MSNEFRRIANIKKVRNTFESAWARGEQVDEEKLIAVLGADDGISRRTAREYIKCAKKLLEDAKKTNAN